MSILSTNHRLISIGESYSAGNGIDITDQVISVTGDAIPYSAGENIDIQDHIISGKDWSNDITEASSHAYNETTAWVKENYTNSADMTYISAVVDTKLDTSAWSSVSGDLATESYVVMSDNITYDRAKGYVDSKDYATEEFVNENTSGKLDSTAFTNWQNGQYSTDLQTIEGQISNKLDESAFGQVSGSFLTAINIPESAVWQDVSTTVQSNSAQWTEGGAGDEEVNSFVYNNSATINEVNTTYQANSGSYQPSGNYIPYTAVDSVFPAFETNSGLEIKTSTVAGSLYNTYINDFHISLSYLSPKIGIDNESLLTTGYLRFRTSSNSAYVDMEKIHTWDSASNYIQSNSANWNDVSTTVQSNSAQWGQVGEFPDSAYNAITSYQQNSGTYLTDNDIVNKLDISAFTAWSAQEFENDYELSAGEGVGFYEDNELKITRIDVTGGVLPYSAEEAITSYQTNSGNYLQKSEFKPTIGRGLTADSFSLAVGSYSKSFQYGLAIGEHTNRYVKNARSNAAIGYSAHAYGTGSQAFGEQVVVSGGMAIGKNNKTSACSFVIGNGTSNTSRNDIFVINYDGSVSAAGKISANGVELGAGGGDVPSGTMNTSALEYNAVGEISGFGSSAIAQYGAEKQWLVHDDTLVHAANSAQYSLGVNVSAVQTLIGLDETVLYSGDLTGNGATAQLSEPIQNFEKIKVYGHTDDGIQFPWFTEFYPTENTIELGVATNNHGWAKWFNFTITTGGIYKNVTGRVLTFGTTTWGDLTNYGMTKVIGIGRKA